MATPTLRALRRRFGPETRMVGVMRPYLAAVLAGTDWLNEQWYFHPRSGEPHWGRRALVDRLRRERFDLGLLLPNSLGSALWAWWGGVRRRVGYARDGRSLLLTDRVQVPRADGRLIEMPMVDYYLKLAEVVGCGAESPRLELRVTPADEQSADETFRRLGLRRDGRIMCWGRDEYGACGTNRAFPSVPTLIKW